MCEKVAQGRCLRVVKKAVEFCVSGRLSQACKGSERSVCIWCFEAVRVSCLSPIFMSSRVTNGGY